MNGSSSNNKFWIVVMKIIGLSNYLQNEKGEI